MSPTTSATSQAPGGFTTYTKNIPNSTPNAAAATGKKDLGETDFLNLLTTQLQHQDPLNPQSDTDFSSQMAQYSSLQQMQKLNENIGKQTALSQMSAAANLIGQNVKTSQVDEAGASVSGVVSSVAITPDGGVTLSIGKSTVPVSKVVGISKATS
jgi:flagellar basal-body rod modification protein FlgD